jgi:hypothetical protein
MSADTRIPSGRAPQYDTSTPALPRNSMSNHVAGNVAMRKTINPAISALIIPDLLGEDGTMHTGRAPAGGG